MIFKVKGKLKLIILKKSDRKEKDYERIASIYDTCNHKWIIENKKGS